MSEEEEGAPQESAPRSHPQVEMAVLGSMQIEREAIVTARQWLSPPDFYVERNRLIFEVISDMADSSRQAIDIRTVEAELRERGKIGEAGGVAYLLECINRVSTAANAESYAKIVRRSSLTRAITAKFYEASKRQTEAQLSELGDLIRMRDGLSAYGILDFQVNLDAALEELLKRTPPPWSTGFAEVDKYLWTLRPGRLMVVGARVGGGKTAFMTKMAVNMAEAGLPVLYITSEMGKLEMLSRILPFTCGVASSKFEKAELEADDLKAIMSAAGSRLSKLPLKIMGKPRVSLEDIRAATLQTGAQYVFVDYLQRCKFAKADTRAYAIGDFMADLKTFLQEAQIGGCIGCQLDRGRDKDPNKSPTNSDLKDSGGIEAEADQVLLFWRPPAKLLHGAKPAEGCIAIEGIISKQRNGPSPKYAQLQLNGQFVDMCDRVEEAQEERLL